MTRNTRRGAVVCAVMLALAWTAVTVAAPTPAQKCAASKVKAAGKTVFDRTKCERKGLLKGIATDPACITKVDTKLASLFASAEGKGGCTVTGDAGDVQTAVDACLAAFDGVIDGDNFCEAAKFKAVGKKTSGKALCWQKAYLVGAVADPACLDLVEVKFNEAIAKADTFGPCTDTAVVLEALVDDCIDALAVY